LGLSAFLLKNSVYEVKKSLRIRYFLDIFSEKSTTHLDANTQGLK
jgi:hypothetical protein